MRRRKFAFTLVELLVVTAVLAVLAALLFPVFKRVEDASHAAVCQSNFHQVSLATSMYLQDYDDRFMPVSDRPGAVANSMTDHTWVQFVLPYTKNFSVFHCPSDPAPSADLSSFDQDLVPGDTYSEFYTASLHVNTGYNYQYLAPVLLQNGVWNSQPKDESDIHEPSRMVMFVDSKWSLKDSDPNEGGSWLVVPPCRYVAGPTGSVIDTFLGGQAAQSVFVLNVNWEMTGLIPQYGGAWPWHMGRMTVAHVDGSVSSMTPTQLAAGCSMSSNGTPLIANPKAYPWTVF